MSMTCEIPYIENSLLNEASKERKTKEHLNSLRELLAFKDINFNSLKRKGKKDGELFKYVLAPFGAVKDKFDAYLETTKFLKDTIRYKDLDGKKVITIDVLGDTELSQDFLDVFSQEHNLRHEGDILNKNEDLQSIIDNDESRKVLYQILNAEADRIELLLADPDVDTFLKDELRVIKRGFDDENFIYSVESATNFIKYSIAFAERYSKKFKGKESYIKQLEDIEKLPTFDERKKARAFLTKKVEYIKNKFYIFGTLSKISDQLSFASTELDDVFETYNRYSIQNKLEKLRVDPEYLEKVEKLISGAYKNKLELKEEIDRLDVGLSSTEINDMIDSSVFTSMLDQDGNIKQTLLGQVKKAQDDLTDIQNNIKTYMMNAQVDLLYDTSKTYLPEATTTYAKSFELTKDKIKQSILQANGHIGLLDYTFKQGDQLPDEVISLFTTLLHSTLMESEYLSFNELQRINQKFSKYSDRIDAFSELAQTYTFELPNKWEPQFYKSVEIEGEQYLTYTKTSKNELGILVEEQRNFKLPENPVYGRYYKLNESNDDNWAYLTDQGFYVRVQATKALEGKNYNHRIDIEWSVLRKKIDELAQKVIDDGEYIMYSEEGLLPTVIKSISPEGKEYSTKFIKQRIRNAFTNKYQNAQNREEILEKSNEIYNKLKNGSFSPEEKEQIFKRDFKRNLFEKGKKSFYTTALDPQVAETTWLLNLNIESNPRDNKYLVQTKDGRIIDVTVALKFNDEFEESYEMYHNGSLISELDVEFYISKGTSYTTNKIDSVLLRPEFQEALSNPDFKEFFEQITEEYTKIEQQDSSGFLQHGKLGQIVSGDSKTFMEKLKEFAASDSKTTDLTNASYEGLKKFFTTEQGQKFPKVDKNGNYVDHAGNLLPAGAKPVMIKKENLNIDRLDVNKLSPSYSTRLFNQNFVTNNLLTNIMAMSSQSINFNRMYELEPQMRYAMLLSQGSADLNIKERQIVNTIKSKRGVEESKKAAKQADRTLKFILKAYGYDSPVMEDSLGKGTLLEKIIEPLRKSTFFQQIALNVTSAFGSNLPVGQINNYLVASSKKFGLNPSFVLNASKQVAKDVIPILRGTIGNTNVSDSHYMVKLASMFNAIAGLAVEAKDFQEHKSDFQHYASYKSLFMFTTGTEVANQLPLMLGFMKSYELSPGYTLFDAIRIDGETLSSNPSKTGIVSLVDEKGEVVNKTEIAKFVSKLSELLSNAQGDYGKYQKIRARFEYISGLALTFGGWIYPSIRTRFGSGKDIDRKTGSQDFGGYQSAFIANSFGTIDEFKEMFTFGPEESFTEFMKRKGFKSLGKTAIGTAKTFASVPLHVLNLMSGFKGQENDQFKKLLSIKSKDSEEFKTLFNLKQLKNESPEEFEKRLTEAYDFYINSLQTASKEYALVIALMIIGMMAKALIDDDDENDGAGEKFAKFLDVRSRQLVSDLSLNTPLVAPLKPYDFFTQRSKDPFVILRTIDINTKFLYSLLGFQVNLAQGEFNFVIDDRYDKSGPGYNKGDLKISKTASRAFGPLYQILRVLQPEQQEAYLKMINKGAVFTDKDILDEDEIEK